MRTPGRWRIGQFDEHKRVASGFIVTIDRIEKKVWEIAVQPIDDTGPDGACLAMREIDFRFTLRDAKKHGTAMLREVLGRFDK
jgi:hypothetical protein